MCDHRKKSIYRYKGTEDANEEKGLLISLLSINHINSSSFKSGFRCSSRNMNR